jgi:hypothetical protein
MPLILAIEPDRRQASRVAAIARGTLGAELVVADSTEHGVAALNGRVPDLILTSMLLSPKDEAGLRAFDAAGAVPTLVIPVLAAGSSSQRSGKGGLLSRLPWGRGDDSGNGADGCDPDVFAAQITEYLEAAKSARSQDEWAPEVPKVHEVHGVPEVLAAPEHERVVEPSQAQANAADFVASSPDVFEPVHESVPEVPEVVVEARDVVADVPDVVADVPELVADVPEVAAVPLAVVDDAPMAAEAHVTPERTAGKKRLADLTLDLDAVLSATTTFEEPILVSDDEQDDAAVEMDLSMDESSADSSWEEIVLDETEEELTLELETDSSALDLLVAEFEAKYGSLPARRPSRGGPAARGTAVAPQMAASAPSVVPAQPGAVAHALSTVPSWPPLEGLEAQPAETKDELTEVVADFVAALDTSAEEPGDPQHADPDGELWMPLSTSSSAFWPRLDSAVSRRKVVQDEWGFFDPDQCGFRALVARLDEMSR